MRHALDPSWPLLLGWYALAAWLTVAFAQQRGALGAGLVGGLAALATLGTVTGSLRYGDEPALLYLVLASALWGGLAAFTIDRMSVRWLLGFQGFRVFEALLVHRAWMEGLAPPQQSWPPLGADVDLWFGLAAPIVALGSHRLHPAVLHGWNTLGLASLCVSTGLLVISVAPLQLLEPHGAWVTHHPFVWLPSVFAGSALAGHLALFRALYLDPALRP